MKRRIIWIIVGAVLLLALVGLLWWWFLAEAPAPSGTGSLGTSSDRPSQQQPQSGTPTNVGTPIPPPPSSFIGGTTQGTGGGSGSGSGGGTTPPPSTPPGVSWLGGGNIFSPTAINEVDSAVAGGLPNFTGSGSSDGSSSGLGTALAGLGIAGAISCVAFLAPTPATAPAISLPPVIVKDPANDNKSFLDCMTRVIAKVALDQMTASIVQWINSGFEGKPSFVQNYEQFFTNVADQAAGEFIKGSALSFLCSPFQPQIRIAIARSYARRNQAPSCTLTQVTNNINRFLQGDFSSGGWRGLFAFTTMPTNNPYGAYMYAEAGLYSAQGRAVQAGQQELAFGRGFLSQKKCSGVDQNGSPIGPCTIQTPGAVINETLIQALGTNYRQLELADNFDEIVSALINQLLQRTLYSGLANLNTNTASAFGGTPQELQEAQVLLTDLQTGVSLAQQLGYSKQGSIGDIQNAQQQLQTLANCYAGRGDNNAEDDALEQIAQLETRVSLYNNDITRANAAIAVLQQLQTRVTTAAAPSELQVIRNDFNAAIAAGTLITQSVVTQAQQDRTALQSEMAALNQQTASKLNQCYAGT